MAIRDGARNGLHIHRSFAREVMRWVGDGLGLGNLTGCTERLALRLTVGVQEKL